MAVSFEGDEASVQRIIRNAWAFGQANYGWFENPEDNTFYQIMKAITVAILEEIKTERVVPGDINEIVPPDEPKLNNDNDPGPWP